MSLLKPRHRRNKTRAAHSSPVKRVRRLMRIEQMEPRYYLSGNGFLQGFSFVDADLDNHFDAGEAPKVGAIIQLRSADGSTLLGQTTTDANGYYRFDGASTPALTSGTFRLVEIPTAGYVNQGTESSTVLSSATQFSAGTILVNYVDPDLAPSVNIVRKPGLAGAPVSFTLVGGPFNSFTQPDDVHQFQISINGAPDIYTFCMDLLHANPANFPAKPSTTPMSPAVTANLGRIAYLYNTFGTKLLSPTDGAGLQTALWELLYDVSPDLSTGNFKLGPAASNAAAVASANNFLSLSAGHDQRAFFLNVSTAVGHVGDQGMIATESFNFANAPIQNANLSGHKYTDVAGDGAAGTNLPLAGITINLYQDTGTIGVLDGEAVYQFDVTDAAGAYAFSNLTPGKYLIQEIVPSGYTPTSPTTLALTLAAGANVTTGFDFYNFENGRITGTKYDDTTGNGITGDDVVLGGVTINLYQGSDASGPVFKTTVTAGDGTYSFSNLAPGTYFVQEVVPSGSNQTAGNAGYAVTIGPGGVASGGASSGNDFANFKLGKLSGHKYNDLAGDGPAGTNTGLGGWTIILDDKNVLGVVDNGELSAVTDANGNWSIDGVGPGAHVVTEVSQTGWTQTYAPGGFVVTSGAVITGLDFYNFEHGRITGTKYDDKTGDGITGDDVVLGGVTVNLYQGANASGPVFKTTVTAGDGTYSFENLAPGTYFVQEVVPAGSNQTAGSAGYVVTIGPGGVVSGGTSSDNNFANFKLGKLSGHKYNDLAGDGPAGTNTGLGGWTIILDDKNVLGVVDNGELSAVTDANGNWSIDGVGPGAHTVTEVSQTGWTQTYAPGGFNVTSGAFITGLDFYNFKHGRITGTKYNDVTGNSFSDDDTVLGGVTVNLYLGTDASGPLVASTVTAADGTYSFDDLAQGAYFVQETVPAGSQQTGGNAGYVVTIGPGGVASGGTSAGNDFDNFKLGKLSGHKYNDLAGDGPAGTNTGLGGWTIILDDQNVLGVVDNGELSAVTDANGNWSIDGVGAGPHTVTEVSQSGWTQTFAPGGFVVTSGAVITGLDFYNFEHGRITGTKYDDTTGNGITGDDVVLGGVTINLYQGSDASGPVFKTTVTAGDGTYSFSNLAPGTYFVQEVVPSGSNQTAGNAGYAVTIGPGGVASGGASSGNDFANFKLGKLSGHKYNDLAGDGPAGTNTGLGGWTIILDDKNVLGVVDNGELSAVTDANGNWSIDGVGPGAHVVTEVSQTGWTQTYAPGGFVVTSGAVITGLDFYNFEHGRITGTKFTDVTGNSFSDDDTVLGGVTINLYSGTNASGALVASTVTAADGTYSFGNLALGTYFVQETTPSGYQQTGGNAGYVVTIGPGGVGSGGVASGKDFDNFQKGRITGTKFNDVTGNSFSGDDTPLGGVTINLYSGTNASGPLVTSTVTAADGTYSFGDLPLGTYFVQESVPAGSQQTGGNAGYVVTIGAGGVVSGGSATGNNFDNFKLGKLSGHKYNDLAGDGPAGTNTGLGGWTIILDDKNVLGVVDNGELSAVTDANGNWSIDGVGPGAHTVTEVSQSGWTQTFAPGSFNVTSGAVITGLDFYNFQHGRITGTKFTDLTGNSFSGDDTPLAGITVRLYQGTSASGPQLASTTTAADGTYSFNNLAPGTYFVQEDVPAGYVQTGGNAGYVVLVGAGGVGSGGVASGKDFDNFQKGKITGTKFTDITGNSFSGDDTPLGGITVNLYQGSNASGTLLASKVTAADGTYSFDNLAPGTYFVQETLPAGYLQTGGNAGYVVVIGGSGVQSGGVAYGKDFDNFKQGKITGKKFLDLTGNGITGDDTALGGVTIQLYLDMNNSTTLDGPDGGPVATTVTAADGTYAFSPLGPGRYFVKEVVPAGYAQTAPVPAVYTVVITSGLTASGKDFANRLLKPGIDIEKFTNGVDANNMNEGPEILPGQLVTWTYKVKNTGEIAYTFAQVKVTDDNGTPGNTADDFTPTLVAASDVGSDGILSPGEVWTYTASATALDLSQPSASSLTFNFNGNSALTGAAGNIRTFTSGSVSVKTSAFSRDKSTGAWSTAYLGSYSGGLGVTDGSEDGNNNTHTTDNSGRDNYVLFEFSEDIVLDAATLGYVVGDSDLSVWIGSKTNAFNNHQTLSDSFLSSLGFTEVNNGGSSTRTADLNAGQVKGNVIVIAAKKGDSDDYFKIQTAKIQQIVSGCYTNKAVVTAGTASDYDYSYYCNPVGTPNIDIQKFTNGVDATSMANAPEILPGQTVTWTYKVTNTGTLPFTSAQVKVTDDAGTPGNAADDFSPTFVTSSDVGNDGILSPGEVWTYTASAVAQDLLTTSPTSLSFNFNGSSALSGTAGNIRTFTSGSVSVKTSGFSRDKTTGAWSTAYLGSYSGGLGVTDTSEGDGSGNGHTVDNNGRDNYVLFEFSEKVVVDSAFLGYVVGDSDLSVWIGSTTDPFNNHLTLSDSLLTSLGFTEVNLGSSSTRLADLNAGKLAGNVLVIAAKKGDSDDQFKIQTATIQTLVRGCYTNYATVTTGPGGPTDTDVSYYCNPVGTPKIDIEKFTNGIDVASAAQAPVIDPGQIVTWTYKVKNTGAVALAKSEVVVTDDNGTPGSTSDDLLPTLVASSDVGNDGILSPGETWTYTASAAAKNLVAPGAQKTIDFSGNTALSGTAGNIRTFSSGSLSVDASAFSRDKSTGAWSAAYLGSYGGGLGVTDTSEGSGGNNSHTVDNSGRDNYVLFEFNRSIVLDSAFLGYVVGDSDLSIWIGTVADAFANHVTLTDSLLTGLGFTEVNNGGSSTRTANVNAGQVAGNVIVIAAKKGDSDDYFKIQNLIVQELSVGVYQNTAYVNGGGATDSDASFYTNPSASTKFYTVDATADKTFEYSATGASLTSYAAAAGNTNPRGVASTITGDKVWVIDGNKNVYVYDADGALLGSWTASGLTTPEDITVNGSDVWIVDDGANKVFKFAGAATRTSGSQTAASSFALSSYNADAKGLVTDGSSIWVVNDSTTDKVFKYTVGGTLLGSWTIDSRNGSPTGITNNPASVSDIWIVDSADDMVYWYDDGASLTSGSLNAASAFLLAAGNGNPQGIADPPPAYALETRQLATTDVQIFPVPLVVEAAARRDAFADWLTPSAGQSRTSEGQPQVGRASGRASVQLSRGAGWLETVATSQVKSTKAGHAIAASMDAQSLEDGALADRLFADYDATNFDQAALETLAKTHVAKRAALLGRAS